MKKIVVILVSMFFLSGMAIAQESTKKVEKQKTEKTKPEKKKAERPVLTPAEKADKAVERLDKMVSLTPEQKPKVKELALVRAEKMASLKSEQTEAEKDKAAFKAVQSDYRAGIKSILTEEQQNVLAEKKAAHKKGKKEHHCKKGHSDKK